MAKNELFPINGPNFYVGELSQQKTMGQIQTLYS